MSKIFAAILLGMFAFGTMSGVAMSADTAKDGKKDEKKDAKKH
jgi:hypothetical protein